MLLTALIAIGVRFRMAIAFLGIAIMAMQGLDGIIARWVVSGPGRNRQIWSLPTYQGNLPLAAVD
jgi:hypothetical protein